MNFDKWLMYGTAINLKSCIGNTCTIQLLTSDEVEEVNRLQKSIIVLLNDSKITLIIHFKGLLNDHLDSQESKFQISYHYLP
jgi:hypothetical protein